MQEDRAEIRSLCRFCRSGRDWRTSLKQAKLSYIQHHPRHTGKKAPGTPSSQMRFKWDVSTCVPSFLVENTQAILQQHAGSRVLCLCQYLISVRTIVVKSDTNGMFQTQIETGKSLHLQEVVQLDLLKNQLCDYWINKICDCSSHKHPFVKCVRQQTIHINDINYHQRDNNNFIDKINLEKTDQRDINSPCMTLMGISLEEITQTRTQLVGKLQIGYFL